MTKLQIDFMNGFETIRHNKEGELLTSKQIAEQARHNLATEQETARSNRAQESLQSELNAINRMNAQTNAINAQTNILNYRESVRANKARESIQRDQNVINAINASANMRNAATNRMNANIHDYEAKTNRMNAETRKKQQVTYDNAASAQIHLNLRQAAFVDRQRENISEQYGVNKANTIINGVKALNPLALFK